MCVAKLGGGSKIGNDLGNRTAQAPTKKIVGISDIFNIVIASLYLSETG